MTDENSMDDEVRLVMEAKRLMTDYTFTLPRFRPADEYQDLLKRVTEFDPDAHQCAATAIVQDVYNYFAICGIRDNDFKAFEKWGREAWEFMPKPNLDDDGGFWVHAGPKCIREDGEWFNQKKKEWKPTNPKVAEVHNYEQEIKLLIARYEDQIREKDLQVIILADRLDNANEKLSKGKATFMETHRMRDEIKRLTKENAELKAKIAEVQKP